MPIDAGSVYVDVGARLDKRDIEAYKRELDKMQARVARKELFRAQLGGDFDARAFNAYERSMRDAQREASKTESAMGGLRRVLGDFNQQAQATRNVVGQIKWPALITGAGLAAQAINNLAAGAVALGSSLAPLSGALAAYPALGSAFAQASGVMKLATAGVGESIGGLNDKLDETSDSFKQLTPEAQAFARAVQDMKKPIVDIQRDAQRGLFEGLSKGAEAASKNVGVLTRGIPRTAAVIGDLAAQAGKLLGSRGFGRDLETQMRRNDTTIRRAGEGGLNLANALRHVTLAAGPLVEWMTRMGVRFTDVIEKQAESARESGKLAAFFDQTRLAMSRVARIGADLAVAFFNIAKAGKPLGDEILVNLVKAADQFRRWTDSARGQNAIARYFRDARPGIFELGRLLRDVTQAFFRLGRGNQIAPILQKLRTELLPVLEDVIGKTTEAFGPPLIDALTELGKFIGHLAGTSGPLTTFVQGFAKALEFLNKLLDRFPAVNEAVVNLTAVGGLYTALKIGGTLTGLTRVIRLLRGVRDGAGAVAAAEVAGGAAGGAAAGGAAAGAGRVGRLAGRLRGIPIVGGIAAAAVALPEIFKDNDDKIGKTGRALERFNRAMEKLNRTGQRNEAGALAAQLDRLVSAGGKFRGTANDVDRLTDAANRLTRGKKDLKSMGEVADEVRGRFQQLASRGKFNMEDFNSVVRNNVRTIRRNLGNSKQGTDAMSENFRDARAVVRRAMRDGETSVRSGLREIRRLMARELKQLGISNLRGEGPQTAAAAEGARDQIITGNRRSRYMGGWMGQRGEVGHDTIPALLAPGEAVLNRHQQAVIEGMLGDGFLDRLFSTVNRPHFMARGGRALRLQAGGRGRFSGSQLEDLWRSVGGARAAAHTMAIIALAESSGDPNAHNPSGASGLWQILGLPFPGNPFDPATNARMAIAKSGNGRNLHPWDASRSVWGSQIGGGGFPGAGGGGGAGPAMVARVWKAIKAPQTAITGELGDIVQGTLDKTTAAANQRGRALAAAAGPIGGGGDGGSMETSTSGLVPRVRAALAFAREHGWRGAVTSGFRSDAEQVRIWNSGVRPAAKPKSLGGPGSNHSQGQAVDISDIPGFQRAMNMMPPNQRLYARVPGDPIHFSVTGHARGGFIQRFQGGGIAGRRGGGLRGYQGGPAAGGGGTKLTLKGLRGIQGDRIENLEDIEANVEDMRENYSRQDRRYSLSDEILIDETTGAVNEGNVKKRANELLKLLAIRAHILQQLRKMRTILRRVVQTYRTIIRRLTRSLRHAKKKERSGIRKQIAHYRTQLSNRQGQLKDLRGDIFDAETDVMEIRAERKEVLGTTAEVRTPDDIASDLSDAGDTGGDIGADTGGDTTEAPPTPLQIAEAAAAEMRTFLAGRQELLTSFGRNFVPTSQAGATFGAPDALTGAAGLRAFGGAGTAGGLGGATVIAHFASSPENAPTFVEQVRFLVGG